MGIYICIYHGCTALYKLTSCDSHTRTQPFIVKVRCEMLEISMTEGLIKHLKIHLYKKDRTIHKCELWNDQLRESGGQQSDFYNQVVSNCNLKKKTFLHVR